MRRGAGLNPFSFLATILVFAGLISIMRSRMGGGDILSEGFEVCDDVFDPDCVFQEDEDALISARRSTSGPSGPVLEAATACLSVGYLCAEVEQRGQIRIQRWKDFGGTVVVHIPLPDFESAGDARRLQNAAAAGVRAWNGQPFPILVDERGNRESHFSVVWRRSLGGSQIGVARTQWFPSTGLTVLALELTTRSPYGSSVNDPAQIRLTAAHEMGHA
jgi:hypothetical protein